MNNKTVGVSVITATNKPDFMKNLFLNFRRQSWRPKELIVILNNDKMDINKYEQLSKYKNIDGVSIHQLPAKASLGKCLNYGIQQSKFEIIAKFDDDDFYATHYLSEAMRKFSRTNADIVGKCRFYMFLQRKKQLMLATMPDKRKVAGATIMFKKSLYPDRKFSNLPKGTDMRFLKDCMNKGYKIQFTSPYNFVAIRRKNQSNHTWKINDKTFRVLHAKVVANTGRYSRLVSRPPADKKFM